MQMKMKWSSKWINGYSRMDILARDMKRLTEGPSDDRTIPESSFSLIGVLSKCVHVIAEDLFSFQFAEPSTLPWTLTQIKHFDLHSMKKHEFHWMFSSSLSTQFQEQRSSSQQVSKSNLLASMIVRSRAVIQHDTQFPPTSVDLLLIRPV
jgi:hypothetical protein